MPLGHGERSVAIPIRSSKPMAKATGFPPRVQQGAGGSFAGMTRKLNHLHCNATAPAGILDIFKPGR